jgi:SAM-dependent methyltransferase
MSNDGFVEQYRNADDYKLAANYGDEYLRWKGWNTDAFGTLSKRDEADIQAIIKKSGITFPPLSSALEIGFGNGGLLAYGKSQQWEMHGTEVNDGLIRRAIQNGYRAVHADKLKLYSSSYFDLVLAFNILEHLPQHVLLAYLREVQRILKDGGVFIARFPNGDSPFARMIQHGDHTHLTTIGSMKANYYIKDLGAETIYIGGEPEPMWHCFPHLVYRVLTVPVKKLISLMLNLLFCPGNPKAFCSLNLIMIIRVVKPTTTVK